MRLSENLNYVEDQFLIQDDTIFAGRGDDRVTLYGGNDFVRMGKGDDFLYVEIDGVDDHIGARGGRGFDTLRVMLRSDVDVFDFIDVRGFERVETVRHWEW